MDETNERVDKALEPYEAQHILDVTKLAGIYITYIYRPGSGEQSSGQGAPALSCDALAMLLALRDLWQACRRDEPFPFLQAAPPAP